jgi:serine/threonine protein kinase
MRGILQAVKFCHERGIIHSDLKLENFVLKETAALGTVKLVDFGCAEILRDNQRSASPLLGSIEYMAPERKDGGTTAPSKEQRLAGDIYSVGVIMFILLAGRYPSGQKLSDSEGWSALSEDARALMSEMLHLDLDQRPAAAEALQSAWLLDGGRQRS